MTANTNLFITGIGTGVGKTVVAAIMVQQLQADYWKPIQSGDLDASDTDSVRALVDDRTTVFHKERHRLKLAASPHKSAAIEGVEIRIEDFTLPKSSRRLVIEGAGGVLVPISDDFYMVDLIQLFKAAVVLVVRDYLGCINHTILTIKFLKQQNIPIAYLVFNGDIDEDTARVILKNAPLNTKIVRIPEFDTFDKAQIKNCKLE